MSNVDYRPGSESGDPSPLLQVTYRLFGEGPDIQPISRTQLLGMLAEVLPSINAHSTRAWEETARLHARNEEYYRGLLDEIADHLADPRAYVSDDGSVQEDPIRVRLPALVRGLVHEHRELRGYRCGAEIALRACGEVTTRDDVLASIASEIGARDGENVGEAVKRIVRSVRTIEKLTARGGSLDDLDYIRQEVERLDLPAGA